ncbi:MAG TPA: sugar-binding protein [Draconibacterium sp.]|nr:sugar-binding protein [Draconibacterium sp.]
MIIRFLLISAFYFILPGILAGQTQNDTIFCYKTKTPVVVDGQATEDCWANAEWHAIDQVWIPWNAKMKEGDFTGRFKVAWDELYLYVLAEVVDDSLSDDHTNPLQNYWDDDCLEVFIDENRSKGDHERNCNAFAYHVSLVYDAVDINSSGGGVNYKNNLKADMDTIGEDTYLWELAIKNYDASFNISNPENSRVNLVHNKKMGFAIAYCDNDETTARENFIGSMIMTQATANNMYKNADHFGLMVLTDPELSTNAEINHLRNDIKIYPVPAQKILTIETPAAGPTMNFVSISTITGQIAISESFIENRHNMNIEELETGIYIVKVIQGNNSYSKIIVKQR